MIERHALMTCDRGHEDVAGPLYYFKPYDRQPGPYSKQIHRKAIIDVADDGTLAGVELIDDMPPPPRPTDPPSDVVTLLGERCQEYDPDCATCLAHKQADEIAHIGKQLVAANTRADAAQAEAAKLRAMLRKLVLSAAWNEEVDVTEFLEEAFAED